MLGATEIGTGLANYFFCFARISSNAAANFVEVDLLGDILRSELRLLQRASIHILARLPVGE
jgi:hypothetical protein